MKYGCNGDLPVMSIADWNTLSGKIDNGGYTNEWQIGYDAGYEDRMLEEMEGGRG